MRLPELPPRAAVLSEKALTARLFMGDERVRRERGELCGDADVACPFGCVDEAGRGVAFDLKHAILMCEHVPIAAAREGGRPDAVRRALNAQDFVLW